MKLPLAILTAVIAFALISLARSQGPPVDSDGKLAHRFPYAVSLQDPDRNHICGAAFVAIGWILTAAQCVSPLVKKSLGLDHFVISIEIAATGESPKETFPVMTIVHPQFDGNVQNGFDIALIYVGEISKQEILRTPQAMSKLSKGKKLFNLAWGTSEDFSSQLRAIPTSSMSINTCNSAERGWKDGMKCGMMCVSVPSTGYCRGEAGTPLILADHPSDLSKGNPSFDILVGISSFGEGKCKKNSRPAVFTQVSNFQDWINETIDSTQEGVPQQQEDPDEEAPMASSENPVNPQCKPPPVSVTPQPALEPNDPPAKEPSTPRCTGECEELNKQLLDAAKKGDADETKRLLAEGADLESTGSSGQTPLHEAAYKGHAGVIRILLAAGAQPDVQDNKGWTALLWASRYGHADVVELLLDAGAQPDVQENYGETALMWASWHGHADVVELLLDAGAQPDVQDKDGQTALMGASDRGHADVVELLLDAGAQPDVQENDGWTALILASRWGHADVVELLLDAGAQPDVQNNKGYTALLWASRYGHADVVELLLDAGAQPDVQDIYGQTALIRASYWGHADVVELLLDAGASKTLKDDDGKTALDIAQEEDEDAVVAVLTSGG